MFWKTESDSYSSWIFKLISFTFGNLFILSLVGFLPIMDRWLMLGVAITLYLIGSFCGKWKGSREEFNLLLIGALLGVLIQTVISPTNLFRPSDFLLTSSALFLGAYSVNNDSDIGDYCRTISVIFSISVVTTIGLGYIFVNPEFLGPIIVPAIFPCIFFYRYFTETWFESITVGVAYGSAILISITQFTDYGGLSTELGWRSRGSWTIIHFIVGACLFAIISRKTESQPYFERLDFQMDRFLRSRSLLPLVSLAIAILLFGPGLFDTSEPRNHVAYTLGLFNILSSNLVEFGVANQCGNVDLIEGNMAWAYSGCWVYPTGWWNPGMWFLVPAHMLGVNPIIGARIIVLLIQAAIMWQLGAVVSMWYNSRIGLFSIIFYSLTMQVMYFGEIYSFQAPAFLFGLVTIRIWTPILKEEEFGISRQYLGYFSIIAGPIFFGNDVTVFLMGLFSVTILLNIGNRRKSALYLGICTISGLSSLLIWIQILDYFWGPWGGSDVLLFEKAESRSMATTFLVNPDYYFITFERFATLLGAPAICGFLFLTLQAIPRLLIGSEGEKGEMFGIAVISSPFLAVQLQYSILFPQSIWQHDYMNVMWILIPCVVGLAFFLSRLENYKVVIIAISILFFTAGEYQKMTSEEWRYYKPEHHQVQDWMWENVDEQTILISEDLYYETHYTAFLAGPNVLTRPVNDTSGYTERWLLSDDLTVVILNNKSMDYWPVMDYLNEENGWCEILRTNHISDSYTIFEKCQ